VIGRKDHSRSGTQRGRARCPPISRTNQPSHRLRSSPLDPSLRQPVPLLARAQRLTHRERRCIQDLAKSSDRPGASPPRRCRVLSFVYSGPPTPGTLARWPAKAQTSSLARQSSLNRCGSSVRDVPYSTVAFAVLRVRRVWRPPLCRETQGSPACRCREFSRRERYRTSSAMRMVDPHQPRHRPWQPPWRDRSRAGNPSQAIARRPY
jgi:hypothetical protein